MNIYNDSQSTSTTSYPPAPTFTTVDTQNVIIRNGLQITGATKGGVLICENTSNDIGELVLGPQDFVMASDLNNTGLPIWRNNLILNEITTNQIKIPGVVQGDLLVGQNTNYLGRLPIGSNDQVLFSNGTNIGWLSPNARNSYYYNAGTNNNVPFNVIGIVFNSTTLNLIIGKRYKITVSARISSLADTNFDLAFNGTSVAIFNYLFNNDMARTFLYTATTVNVIINLNGQTNNANSSIYDFLITAEEF